MPDLPAPRRRPMRFYAIHTLAAQFAASVALCASIGIAAGETPAAPAPAKPECGAKPEYPGPLGSDTQRRIWQKEATAYLECYKKYAVTLQQVAQEATKAANAAIDE